MEISGSSMVKNPPAMLELQVWSLGQEDPLQKERATHSSILPREYRGQRRLTGYSPWGCMSQTWLGDQITTMCDLCLSVCMWSLLLVSSFSFIPALIFMIPFLLLTLGVFCRCCCLFLIALCVKLGCLFQDFLVSWGRVVLLQILLS